MGRFSTTERATFRKCRRLWSWSGKSRGNLRPKSQNKALAFGSAIHLALAEYHLKGTNPSLAFLATDYVAHQALDDEIELGEQMLEHYFLWNERQIKLSFLVTEYPFEVTIPGTDDIYSGIVDGVAETPDGKIWIVEHKGYKTLAPLRRLKLDDQVVSYIWAINESLGVPIAGVIYNQLLKKAPSHPRLLTSGLFSDNITKGMTYDSYLDGVRKSGQNPDAYKDTLLGLYGAGNPFFQRDYIVRNEYAIENVKKRIYYETRDMGNKDLPLYPNITFTCDYCPFLEPCLMVEDNQNPNFLLKTLFEKGEERVVITEDEV